MVLVVICGPDHYQMGKVRKCCVHNEGIVRCVNSVC
jgi:hypothetical protein